jgi:hypothetical protein
MLSDRRIDLVPRRLDARWHYAGVLPRLGGFNPAQQAVYYPAHSLMARWLRDPLASARKTNLNDHLVHEVLFAVHDYLHAWAYLAMDTVAPPRRFRQRRITRESLEDLVFCHLLSEAAATVGLDYWFLCTISLNQICDVGSRMDLGLTTSYHERFAAEYRRFCPSLRVQDPAFLGYWAEFYASGVLPGFDTRALRQSPLVLEWLGHELRYARKQRRYARQWFAHLSREPIELGEAQLDAPARIDRAWKRRLIADIGALLWDKVKQGKEPDLPMTEPTPWASRSDGRADFRFVNLNAFPTMRAAQTLASHDAASDRFLRYQMLGQVDFARCEPGVRDAAAALLQTSDVTPLERLLRRRARLDACPSEPRDLMLLG